MAFFSVKESVKNPTDFLNTLERLQGAGDCILNDLLDFPQCSLGMQSEDVYSLDSSFKTETYPWSNPKFETSQTTEFRYSCNNKVDGSSSGSIFTPLSANSLPEESNFRDSILPPYEMHVSDDFHSLVMNTSTVDVLDYLEDSGSSFNLTSTSTSYYNTCWEHDTLFLRSGCVGDTETNSEHPDERKLCYSPARSCPSINSYNWSIDNSQLECAPLTEAQCNNCEISGTFEKNETVEKPEAYLKCNGTCYADWSLKSQQKEKDLPVGQFYSGAKYTASTTEKAFTRSLTVKELVSLLNTSSNFQTTTADGSNNCCINENNNIEELSGLQPGSKSSFKNINNNIQPLNQRKKAEHVLLGETKACPNGAASHQWQLPFSAGISTDLHNLNSECSKMKNTVALLNAACRELDETGTTDQDKHNSARISMPSISNTQTNRPLNNMKRVANSEKKFMKVGKRGCFVTVPVEEVNKLMVRDLLNMSGNREEMSIQDSTQEYRKNIRKMLQQKRKRLNIV